MTQDVTVPGNPEPGPDNFSFEDYIEGKSTFPKFNHTAYLNQEAGAEYAALLEEVDLVIAEQAELDKRIAARTASSSNSFVDATLDGLREEREALDERVVKLEAESKVLKQKIRDDSITLVFQVKTPEELGTVTREATRQFHKENQHFKNATEEDLDYMTARSRYMLTAQISHFCLRVILPDGSEKPPPNRRGAELLLSKLISSEMMRLMTSIGQGLGGSQDWADKLDAGFPGGSPDMEDVSLDSYSPEVGEVVGASSADHADRDAFGLERRAEPEARDGGHDFGGGELQGVRNSGLDRALNE